MKVTLYAIPASHPAMAVRKMLELKSIEYKRVDLMPVISRGVLKVLRFPASTIPALRIDDRRITGSRQISQALDDVLPEPALFPADPRARAAVAEAERWGEETLSDGVRRIFWNAVKRNREPLRSYSVGARLGVPIGLAVKTAAPIIAAEMRIHGGDDEAVRADLAAFPGWLDRIDGGIAEGVLDGEQPNAADFQIAAALALAMTLDDLRPPIEARPAGQLARRLMPDFPGKAPPVLPPSWLEPLGAPTTQS